MKRIAIVLLISLLAGIAANGQSTKVLMKTSMGDITLMLYDDTPLHKENFIDLVKTKFFDGISFHRVIPEFMIQAGDPRTKKENTEPAKQLQTIPAEFKINHFHKKGALSAARMGDQVNPQKESSGSQFYIVQGKTLSDAELDQFNSRRKSPFTDDERKIYKEIGGTPHLDFNYTVFGEVTKGIEVVDAISKVACTRTVPDKDVTIISARIIK
jgi:peptidyl-prolyl cis-trans isomerase B (cyclophilin B)